MTLVQRQTGFGKAKWVLLVSTLLKERIESTMGKPIFQWSKEGSFGKDWIVIYNGEYNCSGSYPATKTSRNQTSFDSNMEDTNRYARD
jgi:hypothetical protein